MLTTADYLFAVSVYVAFRRSRLDIVNVLQMLDELRKKNKNIAHLNGATTDHCQ